jgi:LysM repeat protein
MAKTSSEATDGSTAGDSWLNPWDRVATAAVGNARIRFVSDVSQGPGWWQAPDGKWYRPESDRGASTLRRPRAPRRKRPGGLTIVVGATLLLVLIVIVVVAVHSTSDRTRRRTAIVSSTVSTRTATTATTPTTTPLIIYRVRPGDTLTKIANHFHVPISAIVTRNHIANPNRLSQGQTLLIPPAPPLKLTITPPKGQPGQAFQLKLTGAVPSETIRFEIDSATRKYTGGAHTASADGTVTATYQTDLAGPTGTYNVIATGNLGTTIQARFVVDRTGP